MVLGPVKIMVTPPASADGGMDSDELAGGSGLLCTGNVGVVFVLQREEHLAVGDEQPHLFLVGREDHLHEAGLSAVGEQVVVAGHEIVDDRPGDVRR